MTDNYSLFGRKLIQLGNVASIPVTYTRLSDNSSYTPVKGDCLVIFANATKASTGNATYTVPTGWLIAAESPGANDNGVNETAFVFIRAGGADGTATDSPTISVSSTAGVLWQAVTYVLKGVSVNPSPSSPAILSQTGKGGTSNTTNAGVLGYSTVKPDEIVMSFLGLRAPVAAAGLTWSGSTSDLGLTELASTNNFIAVAIQRQAVPGTVRPVPTWTGGAGTVSTVMYIGLAPLGDSVGTIQS